MYIGQMDIIRNSAIKTDKMQVAAKTFMTIARLLAPYLRQREKGQAILLAITTSKSKKGRTFGKNMDDEIVGGFGNRWSAAEHQTLRFAMLFISIYGTPLRYDFDSSPLSKSNVNCTLRVYSQLIIAEELDIVFMSEFQQRNSKSIKDKLKICASYDEHKGNLTIIEIKRILIDKFHIQKFQDVSEPSTGLYVI